MFICLTANTSTDAKLKNSKGAKYFIIIINIIIIVVVIIIVIIISPLWTEVK